MAEVPGLWEVELVASVPTAPLQHASLEGVAGWSVSVFSNLVGVIVGGASPAAFPSIT